jgi:hypothetical protein
MFLMFLFSKQFHFGFKLEGFAQLLEIVSSKLKEALAGYFSV